MCRVYISQERWKMKQENTKLVALQTSVEEERKALAEQITRERTQLEAAKVCVAG